MWSDGSGTVRFTKWKDGEPSNVNDNEHCGEMAEAGEWNDMMCGAENGFVCYERK